MNVDIYWVMKSTSEKNLTFTAKNFWLKHDFKITPATRKDAMTILM
jgi:hypothetical protein